MQDQESLTLYAVSPRCIDNREKIQALSLAKECYSMKLDLLTNATVVDDAIRFVSNRSNEKLERSSNRNEDKEEPDYDEDKNQLEEERKEETGKIATTTPGFLMTKHFKEWNGICP